MKTVSAIIGILSLSFCAVMAQGQTLTHRQINEEILFAPEYEAYKYGRRVDADGVGKSWFERFRIVHLSDIHQCNDNLTEALEIDVFEKAVYRVSYGAFLNYDKSDGGRTAKISYRF